MDNNTRTFLEFHGRSIFLAAHDGQYWVAIKPICQALKVNYDRQYKNLKDDPFFAGVYAKQHTHDSSGRLQEMVCLPERYIYGWLFSIRSDSPDLLAYKQECYDVLFDYFHGPLTLRIEVLRQKLEAEIEVERLQNEVFETEAYLKLREAMSRVKGGARKLAKLDQDIRNGQLTIWQQGQN